MSEYTQPEDLALFALQLLSPSEMSALQRALRADKQAQHSLAEIRGDLSLFALSTATVAAPTSSRAYFLERISREPRYGKSTETILPFASARQEPVPTVTEHRQALRSASDPRNGRGATTMWLGWTAAAALAITSGFLLHERQQLENDVFDLHKQAASLDRKAALGQQVIETLESPTAQKATLTVVTRSTTPQGRVFYRPAQGTLVFVASELKNLAPDKAYELWLIPATGGTPMPAGLFRPDAQGNASVLLPALPTGVVAKAFGVTIENKEGATAPTLPILLAGNAG